MINFVVWFIVGALAGLVASITWIAGLRTHADAQKRLLLIILLVVPLNLAVGMVSAFFAGLVITPLVGGGTIAEGGLGLSGLLMSLLGASVALAIVNSIGRRIAR